MPFHCKPFGPVQALAGLEAWRADNRWWRSRPGIGAILRERYGRGR